MALINCPECHQQVSEHARSCPQCGLLFSDYNEVQKVVLTTDIGEAKRKIPLGIVLIILGILCLVSAIVTTIFGIISGLFFIGFGSVMISGSAEATCPYCNKKGKLTAHAYNYKCPYCKKTSVRKESRLESSR